MSKALREVMQYANEDVASIHKHWIVFVHMARRIIIFAVIIGLVFLKGTKAMIFVGDLINELIPPLPFMISDNLLLIAVMIIFIYAVKEFVKTYIIYKTVGLTINNIQIKGKSGLANIGQVNSSLEKIAYVRTHIPLFGRLFGYGSIEISLNDAAFTMPDMADVEKFQESVILLQEAQKEGRNMRSEERNADFNRDIMYSHAQLDDESRINAARIQAQMLASISQGSQAPQSTLESKQMELIEEQ